MVSAGHVGCTRGSGIVSSAADVLGVSAVAWDERCLWSWLNVYVFVSGQRG